MDPTRILEVDHRMAKDLIGQIKEAKGDKRMPLVQELASALRGHMELEEKVVYPKMQSVTGAEAVTEGVAEHKLSRKALTDVLGMAPEKPGFGAALEALEAGLDHHIEEEENEVFPKLRSEGEQELAAMATPFMKKRMQLGMPMPAPALAKAFSKQELVTEAESAGLGDARSMKKDQLAEALAAKMAS
jgi:iron-sulfur cluster repair protein YtfE (RIC family)